jgi:tetratricopeptide (TPR) repeat protein
LSRLAFEGRRWEEAEQLTRTLLEFCRQQAHDALGKNPADLDPEEKGKIRNLATAWNELALVHTEQRKDECIADFHQAIELRKSVDGATANTSAISNLGIAYLTIRVPADLDEAEPCFIEALRLTPESDPFSRSKIAGELGFIAKERLERAMAAGEPTDVINRHLSDAIHRYEQALALTPIQEGGSRAVKHNALGHLYSLVDGHVELGLEHLREAIRAAEQVGSHLLAMAARFNLGLVLYRQGRYQDARDYLAASLAGYEAHGAGHGAEALKVRGALAQLEQVLKSPAGATSGRPST